jgi:hypothetical protein
MKRVALYLGCFLMLGAPLGLAQEKDKSDERPKAEERLKAEASSTPVMVRIFFTELDGENKVKHLPYVLYVNAGDSHESRGWTKLRIGSRMPVYVGNNQMQYVDVGTNIDARGSFSNDHQLLLQLSLEHSWAEGDVSVPVTKSDGVQAETPSGHFREPIIRGFKSELDLKLREGQSVESIAAADPISGKMMKAEVSFTVVK